MSEDVVMFLMFIVLVATAYLQWVEAAFFHELGHLYKARKFRYCEAEMTLKFARPLFKVKGCKVLRDISLPSEGYTSLDNNYLVYTDDEVRQIAKAGTKAAIDFIFITGILSLLLIFLMRYTMLGGSESLIRADFIMIISVFITVYCALAQKWKYLKDSEWGDKEIVKDPRGYKEYIRRVLKT